MPRQPRTRRRERKSVPVGRAYLQSTFTTTLITLAWDSWLIWPAMFLQGIVLVHHFSLHHECVHYTVFRTRRLNDVVGQICGLIILLPHRFFRYEHCDHHTYTQLTGDDPELIPLPKTLGENPWGIPALPLGAALLAQQVH